MAQERQLLETLCKDEAVCFIADRHHLTPQQLVRHFLSGEGPTQAEGSTKMTTPLESNEMEILKGLFGAIK